MCDVHSCIDGFSRKILWLKCAHSNHHPGVIASYFLDCVEAVGGYPARLRTDCGTENILIAAIQTFVSGCHTYGSSPGNQRIEAWWSFYRRQHSQWWIDLFETLVSSGSFHPGNVRETDCLRFCFMSLVQQDLDAIRRQWNTHRIRPSAGATCPPGVPDELFYLPCPPATNRLLTDVERLPAEVFQQVERPRTCADHEFDEYLSYLCDFHRFPLPFDTDSAVQLYLQLLPFLAHTV